MHARAVIATIIITILTSSPAHTQGVPITIPSTVHTIHADLIGEFHENLCAFSVASLWGFFDTDGKVVIPPILDHVAGRGYPSFHNGLCLVRMPGTRQTLHEHLGRPTLHQPLFHHGLSVAEDYKTHLFGYIDTTGVFVISPTYSDAGLFSEGLGAVRSAVSSGDLRWGFVDRKGRMVIEPRYEHQPGHFASGRAGFISDATEPHSIGYLDRTGAIAIHPRNAFNGSLDVAGQAIARAWKVGSATLDASPIVAQPVPFAKGLVIAFNPEADPNDLLILNPTGGVVKRLRNPSVDWVGDLHPWQIVVHSSVDDSVHVIQHEKGNTLVTEDGTVVFERIPNGYIRPFHSDRAFLARFDEITKVYRIYFIDRSGTARIEVRRPD